MACSGHGSMSMDNKNTLFVVLLGRAKFDEVMLMSHSGA